MGTPTVFISYSHKDERRKDRLRRHLGVLEQQNRIQIWDDRQIDPGGKWFDDIKLVMDRTAVAVCLISPDYLASNFCTKEEIPYLLERRERDGMILIPVHLRPCVWKAVPWLKESQMLPRDGKSVSIHFRTNWDVVSAEVAERIFNILDDPGYLAPAVTVPRWSPPEKVDIRRLPVTGAELFGRQKELALLDEAWESDAVNVLSLVGWGGMGKSTLVNKWLELLERDNFRGARRVFAWSFYSQGTGERVTSADQFINEALTWFGEPDPTEVSPWVRGQWLADLVRREKTLLVLDGLEPLQSPLDYDQGKIKDPALAMLLSELARQNRGVCVITTREAVADLEPFADTTRQENLERISAEAGRAVLRVGGVRGTDGELEDATRDFGHHALAVNLLAAYLIEILGHPISSAREIPDLDVSEEEGKHPRRVMAAFERRFGDGPEVELLRMLGLFDRPAESEAIAALRGAPAIPGLTDHMQELSEAGWMRLLNTMRQNRLVAPESGHQPGTPDAHPLVREHFGERLKETSPAAWVEAHGRLYEHYKTQAPEYPDTIEEMAPLYAAVVHGCQAGRYQKAYDDVYRNRIHRRDEFCSLKKLGAFGAELAALSGLFDAPWRGPMGGLREASKAFVLSHAGSCLRALGRLAEAAEPMQTGLTGLIAQEDWKNAARAAGNLREVYLALGDLPQAIDYARRSVELADRSGDAFQRTSNRTTLADAMNQAGRLAEADSLFRQAEEMQKERQPQFPILYSLQGFRYCDLLLAQGKQQEVRDRAGQTLERASQHLGLHSIALDHLSLGRACLLEAQREGRGDFSRAEEHLEHAVEGLREARRQDSLPRGLVARAELHRIRCDFEAARRDLEEATSIAERANMGLHQADACLGHARLYAATSERAAARESLDAAREMIERMGYHRRDAEVAELEALLAEGSSSE